MLTNARFSGYEVPSDKMYFQALQVVHPTEPALSPIGFVGFQLPLAPLGELFIGASDIHLIRVSRSTFSGQRRQEAEWAADDGLDHFAMSRSWSRAFGVKPSQMTLARPMVASDTV